MRLDLGAFEGGGRGWGWSRAQRASLDPPATTDGVVAFYFRTARSGSGLRLPIVSDGPVELRFRARALVRSVMGVFVRGNRAGEVLVGTGPWTAYTLEVPAGLATGSGLDLTLALRPLPLVAGEHGGNPEVMVDLVEVYGPAGLRLAWPACLVLAMVPLFFTAFSLLVGLSARWSVVIGALAASLALVLARQAPVPVINAVPRLVPLALLAGLLTHLALRRAVDSLRTRQALAWLVALGVVAHGSLAFFPNHNPPDLETHISRVLDFGGVPFDYPALLRYGSHLPTPSQIAAPGSDLFGTETLIPYSPLSYLVYYLLHRLGLELHWAVTVFNVVLLMAVAPGLWLASRRSWDETAAWVSAALYVLDIPVWHHLGRAHAPASFGAALTVAAFIYLATFADRIDERRRVVLGALLLATASLGYSSSVVLVGLFGFALLALLAADARAISRRARLGLALTVLIGGLVSLAVFYGHYLPGLVRGAGAVEAAPDLFPGATFFIFHNEPRQSLRVWRSGFWLMALLGLLAAPLALRRARPSARPVLVAWLLAWALVMLLKEPAFFPRLLRWAKEDQFVSPLFALLLGAAVAALPRGRWRWAVVGAVIGTAVWLQVADFVNHADSLRLT